MLTSAFIYDVTCRCSPDVTVTCQTCKENVWQLYGGVRSNLTVRYTVDNDKFTVLTINYNGTRNTIDVSPKAINAKGVKDKRFTSPKMVTIGNTVQVKQLLSKSYQKLNFWHEFFTQ